MDRKLWYASHLSELVPFLMSALGDDCQLLLYDLTQPLPAASRSASTRPTSRQRPSRPAPSPNPYTVSPPTTPSQSRKTPSPAEAVEVLPAKAWTAETEVNNLAFSDSGEFVGCVSGQKLSVLQV
jgi:WD repeat-containing protein 68